MAISCLLCRKGDSSPERNSIKFSSNIRQIYDLWETPYSQKIADGACTYSVFCENCDCLITRGTELRRKLSSIKQQIATLVYDYQIDEADIEGKAVLTELALFIQYEPKCAMLMKDELPSQDRNTGEINAPVSVIKSTPANFRSGEILTPEVEMIEGNEPIDLPVSSNKQEDNISQEEKTNSLRKRRIKTGAKDEPRKTSRRTVSMIVHPKHKAIKVLKPDENQEDSNLNESEYMDEMDESEDGVTFYETPGYLIKNRKMTQKELLKLRASRLYQCFVCEEKFCSGISFGLHLQISHSDGASRVKDRSFQCCFCRLTFFESAFNRLRANDKCFCHAADQKTVVRRTGDCCSQPTYEKFAEVHLRGCMGFWYLKPQPSDTKLRCFICDEQHGLDYDFVLHLETHYKTALEGNELCTVCPYRTTDPKVFDLHLMHQHSLKRLGNDLYFCYYCSAYYMPLYPYLESGRYIPEEYENFKTFTTIHAGCREEPRARITTFKCKWCQHVCKTPETLFRHEAHNHTKKLNHVCAQCNACFFTVGELQQHNERHQGKFECEVCKKSFINKYKLKIHQAVHTGERSFVCEECGASFYTHQNLHIHRGTHVQTKEFPCPTCGKFFKNKKGVQDHIYQVHQKRRKPSQQRPGS